MLDGGDLVTAALAGMLGEDLMRKIATRPFGFWVLWGIGFLLMNILFIALIVSLYLFSLFSGEVMGDPLLEFIYGPYMMLQPGMTLVPLGLGFMFALGYRGHYRKNSGQYRRSG